MINSTMIKSGGEIKEQQKKKKYIKQEKQNSQTQFIKIKFLEQK